jgi:aspartyl-tRNA(Asn)/glutamyl-tRNA(Gln) amidotransferase subunit C
MVVVSINGSQPLKIDRSMVEHIAELAKLRLTDEEIERYAGQLSAILEYAEKLQAVNTDAIPPTASVLPLRNVLRSDVAQPSLNRDAALANAADTAEGQFRVEAVLEDLS